MALKRQLQRLARRVGYDITPFTAKWHPVARRLHLMTYFQVDLVLDVGANAGQYARELRSELGFEGRICSFEPVSDAYRALEEQARGDAKWRVFNLALGDAAGTATINVAENSESSSLLEMLPAHLEAAPEAGIIRTESVQVATLDAIFDDVCRPGEHVYLKVDTQGFEGRVLAGADRSLSKIDTVQIEMALTPLYEGEMSFTDLSRLLHERGYTIVGLEPGFADPRTGQLLQVDGIFHRFPEAATPTSRDSV